jgi:beta-galactosidase beta subunit
VWDTLQVTHEKTEAKQLCVNQYLDIRVCAFSHEAVYYDELVEIQSKCESYTDGVDVISSATIDKTLLS